MTTSRMNTVPSDREIAGAFAPLIHRTQTASKLEHARIAQEKLDELKESGAGQEAIDAVNDVMRSIYGFAPETPLKTKAALQQDTLAALSLYISRHTWTQLTTEQKECLADAIDKDRQGEPDLAPVDRWWRD